MEEKDYKVVLTVDPNLNSQQKKFISDKIAELEKKFCVMSKDNHNYFHADDNEQEEFGSVSFFYCLLCEYKSFFSQLEYYDFEDGETDITV